tara:strand:+ start:3349 stop:3624 length:276 start_codon:yes stop_codon:yes gene_type:complete
MDEQATTAAEANANLTLWCVHVLGADDVFAKATHAEAVENAAALNRAVHCRNDPPGDILCFAYAAPWPHDAESHAEDMRKWAARPAPAGDE